MLRKHFFTDETSETVIIFDGEAPESGDAIASRETGEAKLEETAENFKGSEFNATPGEVKKKKSPEEAHVSTGKCSELINQPESVELEDAIGKAPSTAAINVIDPKQHLENETEDQLVINTAALVKVATNLDKLGQCLIQYNKFTVDKVGLEKELSVEKQILNNVATDKPTVAEILRSKRSSKEAHVSTGKCFGSIGQPESTELEDDIGITPIPSSATTINDLDAEQHVKNAIKLQLAIEVADLEKVASNFNILGQYLIQSSKFAVHNGCLKKELHLKKKNLNNVPADTNVTSTENEIDQCVDKKKKSSEEAHVLSEKCLKSIGQPGSTELVDERPKPSSDGAIDDDDAKQQLVNAIKQRSEIDATAFARVSSDVDKLKQCFIKMQEFALNKRWLEKELNFETQSSIDIATDEYLISTVREINRCLLEMTELADAEESLKKAINQQRISTDVAVLEMWVAQIMQASIVGKVVNNCQNICQYLLQKNELFDALKSLKNCYLMNIVRKSILINLVKMEKILLDYYA